MAQYECRILNDDGSVRFSAAAQITEEDVPRFFAAYRASYELGDGVPDEEVFGRYAQGILAGTIANVESYERAVAVAAITAAPIQFTPQGTENA